MNGWWAVEVSQSGSYRFELRRWPQELDIPIHSPYQDAEFNRETTPGQTIRPVKARLKIGPIDRTLPVTAADKAVIFDVDLEKGPARLETWLYDEGGIERGAYFVYVERVVF